MLRKPPLTHVPKIRERTHGRPPAQDSKSNVTRESQSEHDRKRQHGEHTFCHLWDAPDEFVEVKSSRRRSVGLSARTQWGEGRYSNAGGLKPK